MLAVPTEAGFDFTSAVERRGTDSAKWARYASKDVIPLWVADMDFVSPPAVIDALKRRIDEGVFGYGEVTHAQVEVVLAYLQRTFRWTVDPSWIVWLPGLVTGLNIACRAVGQKDDAVVTATPIYPPFLSAPTFSERRTVTVPLLRSAQRWEWDFPKLDEAFAESKAKLFELCHPHNPTGRAWSQDELLRVAELAEKYDLVICSDEIHNGLVLSRPESAPHTVLASLSPELAQRTITLMAPSKTFNIPGLGCAFAVISNAALRRRFRAVMNGIVPHVNLLGMVANTAAFSLCDDWHKALISLLTENAAAVEHAVAASPLLAMHPVEATYLAWIDARRLCQEKRLDSPARYFEAHGLGLSDGADFGLPGFVRLNFGTRRALLDEALKRLSVAVA